MVLVDVCYVICDMVPSATWVPVGVSIGAINPKAASVDHIIVDHYSQKVKILCLRLNCCQLPPFLLTSLLGIPPRYCFSCYDMVFLSSESVVVVIVIIVVVVIVVVIIVVVVIVVVVA